MVIILFLIVAVIGMVLAIGFTFLVIQWLIALLIAAMVAVAAGIAGGLIIQAVFDIDALPAGGAISIAAFLLTLMVRNRRHSASGDMVSTRHLQETSSAEPSVNGGSPIVPTRLSRRIADLQAEIARALAADPLAVELTDWGIVIDTRVPELIAATEAVHASAPNTERDTLIAALESDLTAICEGCESSLASTRTVARDRLAIMRRYVAGRVGMP